MTPHNPTAADHRAEGLGWLVVLTFAAIGLALGLAFIPTVPEVLWVPVEWVVEFWWLVAGAIAIWWWAA